MISVLNMENWKIEKIKNKKKMKINEIERSYYEINVLICKNQINIVSFHRVTGVINSFQDRTSPIQLAS